MSIDPFAGLEVEEELELSEYQSVIQEMVRALGLPADPTQDNSNMQKFKYRWLNLFLDPDSHATFMNASGAARACGVTCETVAAYNSFGYRCRRHFRQIIAKWLDEEGVTPEYIKNKLWQLMDAREYAGKRQVVIDGVTVGEEEIYKPVHATQFAATKLNAQIHGMLVEKHQHSGDPDNPIVHSHTITPEMAEKLQEIYGDEV